MPIILDPQYSVTKVPMALGILRQIIMVNNWRVFKSSMLFSAKSRQDEIWRYSGDYVRIDGMVVYSILHCNILSVYSA